MQRFLGFQTPFLAHYLLSVRFSNQKTKNRRCSEVGFILFGTLVNYLDSKSEFFIILCTRHVYHRDTLYSLIFKLIIDHNISATITSLFLPETLGKPLSQTMEEAENGYSTNYEIEKIRRTNDDTKTNEGFSEL